MTFMIGDLEVHLEGNGIGLIFIVHHGAWSMLAFYRFLLLASLERAWSTSVHSSPPFLTPAARTLMMTWVGRVWFHGRLFDDEGNFEYAGRMSMPCPLVL